MTDLSGCILELTHKVRTQETQISVLLDRIEELERLQRESKLLDRRPYQVSITRILPYKTHKDFTSLDSIV
jgi:hypothetical protein